MQYMYKNLFDLPVEIIYYLLLWLDRKSFLSLNSVDKWIHSVCNDTNVRNKVQVFPYMATIPNDITVSPTIEADPVVGRIICIERPDRSLCSLDIPCIVVYNNPSTQYLGVILPRLSVDHDLDPELSNIKFGACRILNGTYLHKEHFRLARSSKQLICTMRDEIVQKLNEPDLPTQLYHVCKINKYNLKSSGRWLDNMKENLKMGLTLSDQIYLNPDFQFSESIEHFNAIL